MSENYLGIMTRIMNGNYHLVYLYHMEKLRFIGILAYPKILRQVLHVIVKNHRFIQKEKYHRVICNKYKS